ncbi:DMT family transporter [Flavobacterium orientale]|uniref:Permease n=1 Tax=Flavobacterium orientale TaxID=1756020 RepID=A0A917DFR8_9FLAO|nr:DMT family transporter [Flavobacterium orientale]GGD34034.1 permease [Flavobacterium orientale]
MENKNLKFVFLIILALVWGSSFILIKRGLVGLNPFQLGSLRMVFAALFLLIIGFNSIKHIQLRHWKYIAFTAIMGTFIPVFLFSVAQTQISSSVSAILNSLTPLNTLVLGIILFKIDFQRRQIFGVFIGLTGSALLIMNGALNNPDQNYYYAILLVIASICYALNVNIIKTYLSDLNPLSITAGNFVVILFPALAVLYFSDFFTAVQTEATQNVLVYILILGVVGTALANILFFKLIKISSPVFASSVTYLIPVVAFLWGMVDHETLTFVQLIGASIILLGVYLSAKK